MPALPPASKSGSRPPTPQQTLYSALPDLAAAKDQSEAFQIAVNALRGLDGVSALLVREGGAYRFSAIQDHDTRKKLTLPEALAIPRADLEKALRSGAPLSIDDLSAAPGELAGTLNVFSNLGCKRAILSRIGSEDDTSGALVLAFRDGARLDEALIQAITTLAATLSVSLERVTAVEGLRAQIHRLQTVAQFSQDVAMQTELDGVCRSLHHQVIDGIGETAFLVGIAEPRGDKYPIRYHSTHHEKSAAANLRFEQLAAHLAHTAKPLLLNDRVDEALKSLSIEIKGKLPKSLLGISLVNGQRIVGAVLLYDLDTEGRYTQADLDLLASLAPSAAAALDSAGTLSEMRRKLERHNLVHRVSVAAVTSQSVDEALASVVKDLKTALGGDRVSVLLVNDERTRLDVRAFSGYGALDLSRVSIPIEEGITGLAALQRQPMRVDDTHADERYIAADSSVRSELALPMIYRDQLLGVLNLENDRLSAYAEEDEAMLAPVAGSLAAMVANARLVDQIRRQVDRERHLYEITSKIRRSVDIQSILQATATELARTLQARRARIEIGLPDRPDGSGRNGNGSSDEVR